MSTIQEKLQSGDIVGAVLDTLEAAVGVRLVHEAVHLPADWRSLLR